MAGKKPRKPSTMSPRRNSSPTADQAKKANEASQASIIQVGAVTHIPVLPPPSPSPNVPKASNPGPSTNSLMEREQGLVDALLLRFKNIVELAAAPNDDVTAEVAAAQAFQTNVETQALVCFYLSPHGLDCCGSAMTTCADDARFARRRICSLSHAS